MKFKFKCIDIKDTPDAYQNVEIDFGAKLTKFPLNIGNKSIENFVQMTTEKGTVIWLDWSIVTSFILD
jgi:hypothetical protein